MSSVPGWGSEGRPTGLDFRTSIKKFAMTSSEYIPTNSSRSTRFSKSTSPA